MTRYAQRTLGATPNLSDWGKTSGIAAYVPTSATGGDTAPPNAASRATVVANFITV